MKLLTRIKLFFWVLFHRKELQAYMDYVHQQNRNVVIYNKFHLYEDGHWGIIVLTDQGEMLECSEILDGQLDSAVQIWSQDIKYYYNSKYDNYKIVNIFSNSNDPEPEGYRIAAKIASRVMTYHVDNNIPRSKFISEIIAEGVA